jgi:hypothetical protein
VRLTEGAVLSRWRARAVRETGRLKTIYDLVTLAIFAGLVVLFLQRSTEEAPRDHMYQYAPPCLGCAVANYVGNQGQPAIAWVLIVAVVGYIFFVLKPFSPAS